MSTRMRLAPHHLAAAELRDLLRRRLAQRGPQPEELRFGPFPPALSERLRHLMPAALRPAAVLIPLVERGEDLNVLLTYRSTDLEHHAGQISFPGGRLEPGDTDPESGALRETEEEIGLAREYVEILGRLPDHVIVSGDRVTPVVGLVRPGFTLTLDPTEVAGTFEAPLRHLLAYFLHENLRLRLLFARASILGRQEASFKADVRAAQAWVKQYFDLRARSVQQLSDALGQVLAVPLPDALPDLGASLDAVRALKATQERRAATPPTTPPRANR